MAEEHKKSTCARCHRPIIIRKEGQIYGPTCAKIEAASIAALERYGRPAVGSIV